jgi:hypothetical protein
MIDAETSSRISPAGERTALQRDPVHDLMLVYRLITSYSRHGPLDGANADLSRWRF